MCLLVAGCVDSGDDGIGRPPDDPDHPPPVRPGEPPVGPCGEIRCSPKTPDGVDFAGVVPVVNSFPNGSWSSINNHIAVGGLHEVTLRRGGTEDDFTLPYQALSDDLTKLVVEQVDGAHVTLRGYGGKAYLRLVDPGTGELFDRGAYASSEFARAVPLGTDEWITADLFDSAAAFVFAPGHRVIGVAYLNNAGPPNRLVDTTAKISLAGAQQLDWNRIDVPLATAGMHTVTLEIGGAPATMQFEVSDQADTMRQLLVSENIACFGAYRHDAFIAGLAWTFTADGVPVTETSLFGPNCYFNQTAAAQEVTARAGGKTMTVTVPAGR